MAIRDFAWKHLDETSLELKINMKLREAKSWNFLQEYPKLMWDSGEHKGTGWNIFFENENYDFSPILSLRNRQILGFFHCWLNRSLEVRFHFSTPVSESRDQAQPF